MCALGVWYARKSLPEFPRWLESVDRTAEADALIQKIEAEVEAEKGPLPAPVITRVQPASRDIGSLLAQPLLTRMVVGSIVLIVINTLLYGSRQKTRDGSLGGCRKSMTPSGNPWFILESYEIY